MALVSGAGSIDGLDVSFNEKSGMKCKMIEGSQAEDYTECEEDRTPDRYLRRPLPEI
ncbi:MAG: hypothetical protein ACLFWL_13260 [Candidatus Brocadiia bacterium]